jgi:hypothetical protein
MLGRKVTGLGLFCSLVLVALSITLILPLSSCVKNQTCTAVIIITDSVTGGPKAGYSIDLTYNITSPNRTNNYGTTDGTGTCTFTFPNPAIYDVLVSPTKGGSPTFDVGIIKLVQGQSVTQTFVWR